jgi:D-sedoheptulose 7-phosphate isomerase
MRTILKTLDVAGGAARDTFRCLMEERRGLLDTGRYEAGVLEVAAAFIHALRGGHAIYWMGNGGSAADAQHLAAEFSGRFRIERPGLPSHSLSCNTSAVTAIANDYGYERIFSRQAEAFAQPGDVFVGISTSGNSRNIVLGLQAAKRKGAVTVAFSGNGGGAVAEAADHRIVGPDGYSAPIQEIHITLGHIICDLVERALQTGEKDT